MSDLAIPVQTATPSRRFVPTLTTALQLAFAAVFVLLILVNVRLRAQNEGLRDIIIEQRRGMSSTAFHEGDRFDGATLTTLDGAQSIFDSHTLNEPLLVAVLDPGCDSCRDEATTLARLRPTHLLIISRGDSASTRELLAPLGLERDTRLLSEPTEPYVRLKTGRFPQLFLVSHDGFVTKSCATAERCIAP